jgi:hypothetical protein
MRARRLLGSRVLSARTARRRVAVFALFFVFLAGAALAGGYTALASDVAAGGAAGDPAVTTDSTTEEPTTSTTDGSDTVEAPPVTSEESPPSDDSGPVEPRAEEPPAETTPDEAEGGSSPPVAGGDDAESGGHAAGGQSGPKPVLAPHPDHRKRAVETSEGAGAVIWLHRVLPDPTPPARRLAPSFARRLRAVSARADVRWSLVLAVLRSRGEEGRLPAGRQRLERLAGRLADSKRAVIGRGERARQIRALERYNRAVGLRALVTGLEKAKGRLARKVLRDRHIAVYPGGRVDLALGRVNVRVIALIRYLRVTFRTVTVTSLVSGHGLFARPGVVSAHIYGLGIDIAALRGLPITGNQQPGGITEKAVQAILRLPAELQPQQVISLLGLGGPSFPLADHYDHIHVGF